MGVKLLTPPNCGAAAFGTLRRELLLEIFELDLEIVSESLVVELELLESESLSAFLFSRLLLLLGAAGCSNCFLLFFAFSESESDVLDFLSFL